MEVEELRELRNAADLMELLQSRQKNFLGDLKGLYQLENRSSDSNSDLAEDEKTDIQLADLIGSVLGDQAEFDPGSKIRDLFQVLGSAENLEKSFLVFSSW